MGKYDEKEIIEPVEEFDEDEVITTEVEDEKTVVLGTVSECVKLRLRREPAVADNVIGELKFADAVYVDLTESTEDFYKVVTEAGAEGYCMKQFINIASE